jgi:hypothetical protein
MKKRGLSGWEWWLMPIILATPEIEIRRMVAES